jgi:Calx-beta domain-containing protein
MARSLLLLCATALLIGAGSVTVAGAGRKPPTLSIANASSAQESARVVFTVRLSAAAPKPVTVRYATADGSATAGSDYSATRGTLVFKRGQRLERISVPLVRNSAPADDETFYVILSRPTNARLAGGQAPGKILAHDLPAPFKARAALKGEAGQGTGEMTMTLDAAKGEASFALTLVGLPEDPGLSHLHAVKDSSVAVTIQPLPPKNGSSTGTIALTRRLIIGIHEDPGNFLIEVHGPTFAWTIGGRVSLVAP